MSEPCASKQPAGSANAAERVARHEPRLLASPRRGVANDARGGNDRSAMRLPSPRRRPTLDGEAPIAPATRFRQRLSLDVGTDTVGEVGFLSWSIERVADPVSDDRFESRGGAESSSPADDASLIAAVLRGDAEARETFVVRMRCVPRMLAALNSQRGRPLDDEQLADLAQDALVVLWRKLAEYRAIASVESWSYGIAYLEFRNACRRCAQLRMRHAQLRDEASRAVDEPSVPEEPVWGDVEEALARLDAEDVAVIRLRHEEELSFDAIGARLGLPSNTAKTRYHRGLKKLREWLRVRDSQEGHPR